MRRRGRTLPPKALAHARRLARAGDEATARQGFQGIVASAGGVAVGHAWAGQHLALESSLVAVSTALNAHGVEALWLKGCALARWLYPDPMQRTMADLDLIVRDADRGRAEAVLESQGFVPGLSAGGTLIFCEQQYLRRIGEFVLPVDLHWRLLTHPVLRDRFSFDALWRRRRRLPGVGYALGPVDALLHAAAHLAVQAAAERKRLIWLLDVHLLWSALTPGQQERACAEAGGLGIAGLLFEALIDARREFGTELPVTCRRTLDEAAVGEASLLLLYQSAGPARLWTQVAALPSWRERGRYLFELAFPPPDYMRRRFRSAGPLAYARRLGGGLRRLLGAPRS